MKRFDNDGEAFHQSGTIVVLNEMNLKTQSRRTQILPFVQNDKMILFMELSNSLPLKTFQTIRSFY